MRALHLLFLFLGFVVTSLSQAGGAEQNDQGDSQNDPEKACQEWVESKFFSEDFRSFAFVGWPGGMPDSYWQAASRSIEQFPQREKVTELYFNYGYISAASLECLAHFPNVETITLGMAPEGVTLPAQDFRSILKFSKLKYLGLAIHGPQNDHFRILSEHPGLLELGVLFPSLHMLQNDKRQPSRWVPANLDDEAARQISRIKSLQWFSMGNAPQPEDGKVSFSEKALTALLESPHLKEGIRLDSRNFTPEGLAALQKTTLPPFVNLKRPNESPASRENYYLGRPISLWEGH
jgi:hypothetical protein